jgi:ethanolamine utilization microcompartment shell protein EutS
MANFKFDPINRIITVLAPDTEITVQELINAIREWEAEHLEYDKIAEASGKETIAPGLQAAITVKLLNWRLKFEDRSEFTVCLVRGGNLLAVDANGNYMYPIAPSTNVSVALAQSTAASLIAEWTRDEIDAERSETHEIWTIVKQRFTYPIKIRSV